MKIKTALKILFVSIFFAFSFGGIYAQSFEGGTFNVGVNANIDKDLYSQLSINPVSVEIKESTQVTIQMMDSGSNPLANRNIQLYIDGSSIGVTIVQPALSDAFGNTTGNVSSSIPGSYRICARDITESLHIDILDCEVLYVTPVPSPSAQAEPQYTIGTTNTIMWSMSGVGPYKYLTQVSKTSDFASVVSDSGWISAQGYEFTNLENGQIYFYRVKARNNFGGESAWSNTVFSVQDSQKPTITLLSVSSIGENTVEQWNSNDLIIIRMRVKDNIIVSSKSFWCVLSDDSPDSCQESESSLGDIWEVTIKLGSLEQDENGYLFENYNFCAEASDSVGNTKRICTITLEVPQKGGEVPPPPTPVEKIINKAKEIIDNTIGKIALDDLENVTVTTVTANIAVGVGILIGSFNSIPYFIIQGVLSLLSVLGFRKRGYPVGYVYDSVTKEPIHQAIVRIFNKNGILVWTDVTDSNGYFRGTNLNKGTYSIKVTARDYVFPSKIVFGKQDFPLENVYHGKEFSVYGEEIPNFSIPLDKVEYGNVRIFFEKIVFQSRVVWKSIHLLLFVGGLIFALYALYISQVWFNYLIVSIYIPSLVLLILSLLNRKGRYGVVRNTKRKRIKGVVVGLKEKEFDKLVSKRVTDSMGRYRFIVNKGVYDIVVLNSGIAIDDYSGLGDISVKDNTVIAKNIVVKRLLNEKEPESEDVLEPLEDL